MNLPYRRSATRQPQEHGQRGFSLVELMVALVVSLLLLAGVIQVYLSSKQAYRVQDNIARIQENGRLAIAFVSRYLRLAGYRPYLQISADQTFPSVGGSCPSPPTSPTTTTNVIWGCDDTWNGNSDTVTINFQSDGTMSDCLGNPVPNLAVTQNTFQVSATGDLQCASSTTNQTQPLVEGVQDMQITYGVNVNNSNYPPAASQYMTAADVTAANAWRNVVSVRIAVLIQSREDSLTDAPQTYTFAGATTTPTDRRLRHVFSSTVNLRNRTL